MERSRAFRRKPLAASIALISYGMAPLAGAAEGVIEEILVTATKRSESVQDVPLAITALTGEFTREVNVNDVKDLVSYTPGVSGNSQDSFIDAISIRGIRTQDFGVGGDPSGAFFKNDLYEGRNGSAVTSLYDMERAEILRGPQGFLFGRNAVGGAFSVYTRRADLGGDPTGYVEVDVAERNRAAAEGAFNLPMGDVLAMRFAGYYSREDGFVDNAFGGDDLIEHDKRGGRWSVAYEGERLSVDTMVEYETREQSGSVYRAIETGDVWDTLEAALGDLEVRGDSYDADSDHAGGDSDDADILTLGARLEYDLDFAVLTSNTGYKDHDYYYNEDYDGTPINLSNYRQDQEGEYFQQELRLTSQGDGPFSWYAGASYYQEDIDTLFRFSGEEDFYCQYYGYAAYAQTFTGCAELFAYYGEPWLPAPDGLLTETGRIVGDYSGWAVYADLNFQVTDTLDVSVGARYTDDEKDFALNVPEPESGLGPYFAYTFATDGFVHDTDDWTDLQTRVAARWFFTDDHMFFANYTEGFKSGGFGSFTMQDADGNPVGGGLTGATQADGFRPRTFDPEVADSYEAGWKGTLLEGGMQLAVTGFYYEYQDLQVVVFDGGASAVENVGEVESAGIEVSANMLLGDYFDVYLAYSYLDSEATELADICGLADPNACDGGPLFWAPEHTAAFVVTGNFPIDGGSAITANFESFYESSRGRGWDGLAETEIDPFVDVALRVGYESAGAWGAELYVENLTDEESWDGENNNGGVLPSHFFGPKRPRTVGIRFTYDWE